MIPRLNQDEFSQGEYVARNSPAIITDGLHDWSEQGRWSPQLLCSSIGKCSVRVGVSADERFNFKPARVREEAAEFSVREMEFSEAARIICEGRGSDRLYVMQQSIPEKLPQLLDKIAVPQWIANQAPARTNLWFGAGSVTQLHYDGQNNFFAQLHGIKQFIVFSPEDTPCLYPFPLTSLHPHTSHVDPDQPDIQRHPLFALAKPIRFVVQPGELLFLPAFWWHWVKAPEVSISINFWWPASLSQYLAAPNSLRNFYQLYMTDRLQALQKGTLAPKGLDFCSAAELLLGHGANWGAGMLALAAFDQVVSTMCSTLSIDRPEGCAVRDLPEELAAIRPKLAHRHELMQSFEIATRLALEVEQGDDSKVTESNIRSLTTLARALDSEQHAGGLRTPSAAEARQDSLHDVASNDTGGALIGRVP